MSQYYFEKEWFKSAPKWKILLVKIFGHFTASEEFDGENYYRTEGYYFRGCLYVTKHSKRSKFVNPT